MKAYLNGSIYSIDLPSGPPEMPKDPYDCWIVIQADIGVAGKEGADIFTFYVCTAKRVNSILQNEDFLLGHHLILVEKFDWQVVENAIKNILNNLEANTWEQLAIKLNEYGGWEFSDYDDEPVD